MTRYAQWTARLLYAIRSSHADLCVDASTICSLVMRTGASSRLIDYRSRIFRSAPTVHVNYAEMVLHIRDGLPKFKDFPAEIGQSGEQIAE